MAKRRKDRSQRSENLPRSKPLSSGKAWTGRNTRKAVEPFSSAPNPLANKRVPWASAIQKTRAKLNRTQNTPSLSHTFTPSVAQGVTTSNAPRSAPKTKVAPATGLRDRRAAIAAQQTDANHKKTWRDPTLQTAPSPGPRSDERKRENKLCKSRPRQTKGNGGSRAFVPWCKR